MKKLLKFQQTNANKMARQKIGYVCHTDFDLILLRNALSLPWTSHWFTVTEYGDRQLFSLSYRMPSCTYYHH